MLVTSKRVVNSTLSGVWRPKLLLIHYYCAVDGESPRRCEGESMLLWGGDVEGGCSGVQYRDAEGADLVATSHLRRRGRATMTALTFFPA